MSAPRSRPGSRPTTRLSLPALALLACAVPAAAQQADTALVSLVDAERAFSAHSQASGVRGAFPAYAAEDGVVFTPAPVRAGEQWADRATPPVLLTWYPVAAKVSAAGDLGFGYGTFRTDAGAGSFLRVWERGANGVWRVVLDVTSGPPPRSG